jgi:hypothetical protein
MNMSTWNASVALALSAFGGAALGAAAGRAGSTWPVAFGALGIIAVAGAVIVTLLNQRSGISRSEPGHENTAGAG